MMLISMARSHSFRSIDRDAAGDHFQPIRDYLNSFQPLYQYLGDLT
jgi:hypothetical protein